MVDLYEAINETLKKEIDKVREQVIKDAVDQFEANLRAAVGNVALKLVDYFSVERNGPEILIRVKYDVTRS